MPVDLSVFDGIKSFDDYNKLEQEFQLKKQLAIAGVQKDNIDAATKANIYATQAISGAVAGGQGAYDQTRAKLQNMGLDVSGWAPDVETATQQATAARMAQSPYGTLFNAQQKVIGNNIAAANAFGGIDAAQGNGLYQPVPLLPGLPSTTGQPVAAPVITPPRSGPQAQNVIPEDWSNPPVVTNNAPSPPLGNPGAVVNLYGGDETQSPPPSAVATPTVAKFSPPRQNTGETNAAYNQRVQNAFNAYKEDPAVVAAQAGAKKTAEKTADIGVDRQAGYTKAQSALQSFEMQANLVTETIDKALSTISPISTGYGSILKNLPNTDARKLSNYLDTIKANIGFDKLQNMRENSPTGGALGQVSDMENRLLQAVNGALDQGQSEMLPENLKTIKTLYPQVLAERKRAFAQDYGGYQPIGGNVQPPPATPTNSPSTNSGFKFLGFKK